ncbi:Jerky -like [Chionoecetes opilio]|nr:Jerky -like [Chionoecetes opilio]KAG0716761.1 Jerky -like [Chionoecetes opilio]KAG0719433.1 Jerky -like [Chionoecetes opilio]KAG0721723.1 Jerky -like [Chionoecetes opilio]
MVPMPRNYQPRNILTTDRTNLEKAFNHRIETGCSIRTACNLFGVKVSTLGDAFTRSLKESDGRTFVPKHQNIKKVFTDAQEHFIEEYSIKISRMFYGLSTRAFRRMVLKYAEAVGSPAISDVWRRVGMATRDWYYGYMFRHPRLALKAPEGMSLARAMAFNRVNVEVFFKAYVEAVERHSFMPARIFNLDESGLSTVMKPCKVVCEKGRPVASQVARERGNHMTFVGIVNAAGHGFPPVFIIARKKMHADFQRGTTPGTTVLLQANGWMDHECFVQTLEHLHKVSYSSMENKILLIMDNAECHMSIHAAEYAIQHGIVIVTLPPHTTAKLQPLDVSVFGPFKSVLRSIQDDFKLSNTHVPITEHMLPEMACKAWDKVCNVTNITNGFRATGIFPVNRNIFPDDAFAGAEVTEQAPPDDDDDLPQTLAAPLTPSSLEPDQPQPGPSGIGRMSPAFFASAASTPEAAPQPRQTPTPTASSPPILDVTPEAVQPYPKAPPRPAARGRKKIRACILTEDEEALDQLREKEKKKAAREEKKRRSEEKKREKKREQEARQAAKRRRRSEPVEASSSDEEAADNPALCDDSSEYSDEFAEELEHDAATYPFVQKEPEVGDFVLVQLVFKGKRSEELVHFVAKVISLEEDGRLQLDFLRIKSPLLKDTFHFPAIGDVDSVDRSRVLGVLTVSTGTTQRQANLIKVLPPLRDFNMH